MLVFADDEKVLKGKLENHMIRFSSQMLEWPIITDDGRQVRFGTHLQMYRNIFQALHALPFTTLISMKVRNQTLILHPRACAHIMHREHSLVLFFKPDFEGAGSYRSPNQWTGTSPHETLVWTTEEWKSFFENCIKENLTRQVEDIEDAIASYQLRLGSLESILGLL